ncbi:uncharacterized protein LOC135469013 isoform X3 [Liolophura sinensis]|uniref:uncharacterized protein LOC135469013 isoform X3 n=1 Tax=Liolophura sinensis TaxID=3198878 RepID=UPI003158B6B1
MHLRGNAYSFQWCIFNDKRSRGSMAESRLFHHNRSFTNLRHTYDIDDTLKNKLKSHDLDSIVALTHISEERTMCLTRELSIGYGSRITGAIMELQKWSRSISCLSLYETDTNHSVNVSKIDHAKDFKEFCVRHDVKPDTVDVLSKYDCNSLPALRHLPSSELNGLLWELSVGQRAAVTQGIRVLRELQHSMSLPNLTTYTQDEPGSQNRCDEDMKRIHDLIPMDLYQQLAMKADFEDIKRAAKFVLSNKDVHGCNDIRDLWDVLMKRGYIKIANTNAFTNKKPVLPLQQQESGHILKALREKPRRLRRNSMSIPSCHIHKGTKAVDIQNDLTDTSLSNVPLVFVEV